MTTWPDSNGEVFCRYVQGLGLQTAMAARVYHCILRRFQRFISDYDPASPVSEASLTAWIQDRITVWPLHLVIQAVIWGPQCARTFPSCELPVSAMPTTKTVSLVWIGFCSNSRMPLSSLSPFLFSDGHRTLPDSNCTWRGSR